MTERTFTAAEMNATATSTVPFCYCYGDQDAPCSYCDNIAMLRQGAAAIERWEALKAWSRGYRTVRGSADYQQGIVDIFELLDSQMARLEREP